MKRACQTIIALCLPLLFCSPAMAQHSGPYVGASLGVNALMNAKTSDNLGDFNLTFNPALQGSAVIGWDFEPGNPAGEGRVELEYSRRSNQLDQVKFVEGSFNGGGSVTADGLLLNFFGVFHGGNRLSPYAGFGIGAARIKTSDLNVNGYPLSNDSAVVFAYQLGGGVDFALTDHLNLDLGYRFFSSIRPKFNEVNGHTFEMDYINHSAVLGLRVGF
ncbi:MAG: outer membrane beta-barrel protein [Desulfuromonadaceae bacterium]|nr:outer membrane beta-barrel protein [Desulfuromonadaceae bacterium]